MLCPRSLPLVLCCGLFAAGTSAQSLDDNRLRHEVWAEGIERPLGFDFLGPEDVFVFENRTGRVLRVQAGQITAEVLDLTVGDRGGLGLALSPDFASDGFVFLHYTLPANGQDGGTWNGTRIERRRFDGTALVEPLLLLEVPFDPFQPNGTNHDSGTLRFGPDGFLYGQLGDKHRGRLDNGRLEQNTGLASSRCGSVFRLSPDGSLPLDNPFADHPNPQVRAWYVTGFRNSLGFDFDPVGGQLWFGDNGPTSYDEINRAVPGMNAGWLKIMGPDARDATYAENGDQAFDQADLVMLPGATYRDPEFSWLQPIGVTSLQFLPARRFPEDLWGRLWAADFLGRISEFRLSPDRQSLLLSGGLADGVADDAAEAEQPRVGKDFGTVTEIRMGPDGYLYLTDYYGGRIRRIRPVQDRVEPLALSMLAGTVLSGGAQELAGADGRELVLGRPPVRGPGRVLWEAALVYRLEDASPSALELDVAGSTELDGGGLRALLFDTNSSQWIEVGQAALGAAGQPLSFTPPGPATRWVEASTRRVRLRLQLWANPRVEAVALGSAGASPAVEARLDRARLRATLP